MFRNTHNHKIVLKGYSQQAKIPRIVEVCNTCFQINEFLEKFLKTKKKISSFYFDKVTSCRFAGMKFQPVQPGQIFLDDYTWNPNLVPARRDSFSPGICLDLHTLCICKHGLINFFIPPRPTETITWENCVPAIQKTDHAFPGRNFSNVIAGHDL